MAEAALLTIAIPTYNRSSLLAQLLEALEPQLAAHPDVALLISDNSSSDDTQDSTNQFARRVGSQVRLYRQAQNLGADANFIFCFNEARSRYIWICGDDDILVSSDAGAPSALDQLMPHLRAGEFDLVYATSFAFRENWRAERAGDPLHREYHVIESAQRFTRVVNIMFTFISGMVVNKARLLELQNADSTIELPETFLGTNLVQLSWVLPLLRTHRKSLVLWARPVGGRQGNVGGYSLANVFGQQLVAVSRRCLPDRPGLRRILLNNTLRRWLPSILYALRTEGNSGAKMLGDAARLRESYGSNPRFWLFAWPEIILPLPLAKLWLRLGAAASKVIYALEFPSFWRKRG